MNIQRAYSPRTIFEQNVTIVRLLTLLRGPERLNRDGQIVILARSVRTLGYGCNTHRTT